MTDSSRPSSDAAPPSKPLATNLDSTLRLARGVSILGHPMLVMPLAAWLAARASGSGGSSTLMVSAGIVVLGLVVLGYSAIRVRGGDWQHVDASGPIERRGLNIFLLGLFAGAGALAHWQVGYSPMTLALILSAAIILFALLAAGWCKLSLHVAFGSFATFVPGSLAAGSGLAVLVIAVAWSRLILGRHVLSDILAGALAGIVAGVLFQTL